jgi:CO/xanthine dehydrogenase Mo-binding subunit
METPSPDIEFAQKGVGEGRAIGAAVATANAINGGVHATVRECAAL